MVSVRLGAGIVTLVLIAMAIALYLILQNNQSSGSGSNVSWGGTATFTIVTPYNNYSASIYISEAGQIQSNGFLGVTSYNIIGSLNYTDSSRLSSIVNLTSGQSQPFSPQAIQRFSVYNNGVQTNGFYNVSSGTYDVTDCSPWSQSSILWSGQTGTSLWLNEINYKGTGSQVEIMGLPNAPLSYYNYYYSLTASYSLETFDAYGNLIGRTLLTGNLNSNGIATVTLFLDPNQGAIALLSPGGGPNGGGVVLNFVSYGPARVVPITKSAWSYGAVSEPINPTVSTGNSIQLSGTGYKYEAFGWLSAPSSFGSVNANQTFGALILNSAGGQTLTAPQPVFINEISYNGGSYYYGAFEVAAPSWVDIGGYQLYIYSGSGSTLSAYPFSNSCSSYGGSYCSLYRLYALSSSIVGGLSLSGTSLYTNDQQSSVSLNGYGLGYFKLSYLFPSSGVVCLTDSSGNVVHSFTFGTTTPYTLSSSQYTGDSNCVRTHPFTGAYVGSSQTASSSLVGLGYYLQDFTSFKTANTPTLGQYNYNKLSPISQLYGVAYNESMPFQQQLATYPASGITWPSLCGSAAPYWTSCTLTQMIIAGETFSLFTGIDPLSLTVGPVQVLSRGNTLTLKNWVYNQNTAWIPPLRYTLSWTASLCASQNQSDWFGVQGHTTDPKNTLFATGRNSNFYHIASNINPKSNLDLALESNGAFIPKDDETVKAVLKLNLPSFKNAANVKTNTVHGKPPSLSDSLVHFDEMDKQPNADNKKNEVESPGETGSTCYLSAGDGYCDSNCNTATWNFDGGDCCFGTCISTLTYTCGAFSPFTCVASFVVLNQNPHLLSKEDHESSMTVQNVHGHTFVPKAGGAAIQSCLFLHGKGQKGNSAWSPLSGFTMTGGQGSGTNGLYLFTSQASVSPPFAGALAGTYWGPMETNLQGVCNPIFGQTDTTNRGWDNAALQQYYYYAALSVYQSGGIVFAHSMGNMLLAAACWQQNLCGVRWFNVAGPMRGSIQGEVAYNANNSPLVSSSPSLTKPIVVSVLNSLLPLLGVQSPATASCADNYNSAVSGYTGGLAKSSTNVNMLAQIARNKNLLLGSFCAQQTSPPNYGSLLSSILTGNVNGILSSGSDLELWVLGYLGWSSFYYPSACLFGHCIVSPVPTSISSFSQGNDGAVGLYDCGSYAGSGSSSNMFGGFQNSASPSSTTRWFTYNANHFAATGWINGAATTPVHAWYRQMAINWQGCYSKNC